jgi:pimeloyl-ACP methyl ester carboxylesterase
MPDTEINGARLHWQLTGEAGNPLVLVHGSWGDHHGWDLVVPALAKSFRVLAYDRRGHSLSARPAAQGSVREDVADLAALVEHLDLAPAHVVGNSFGGVIALRLAAERPDLFRSLLVHEPPLLGLLDDPAARKQLQAVGERMRAVLDLLARGQMEAGARQFVETIALGPGAWAQLRDTFVFNAPTFVDEERDPESRTLDLSAVAGFARPVLLTQGERSEPFFSLIVERLARALPTAQRRTLPGSGHVPQVTHPEEYVQLIEPFIALAGQPRT